ADLDALKEASAANTKFKNTHDNKLLSPLLQRPSTTAPYNIPDAVVPAKIFAPGPKGFATVQTYRKAVGDQAASEALQGYAVDRLRQMALDPNTGVLDPKKVATFRKQYADALRAFP